jgi:hypothetical protein
MLRYLHRCGEPKEDLEIQSALGVPIAQARYHLHALESYGTIREVGSDSGEMDPRLYESTVSDNAEILAMLEASKADDEAEDRMVTKASSQQRKRTPRGGSRYSACLAFISRFWAKKGRGGFRTQT